MERTGQDNGKRRHRSRSGLPVALVCLLAGYLLASRPAPPGEPELLRLTRPAMGTLVEIVVPAPRDEARRSRVLEAMRDGLAEIARLDSLFSTRLPPPVQTPPAERARERSDLLELGLAVMRESGGAFDPRLRPLIDLWGFDGDAPAVPDPDTLRAAVARLQALGAPRSVGDLAAAADLLHFGAWAKGYAVDRATAVLRSRGVTAALVNAGGEIRCYGRDWTVGVQHPRLPGALVASLHPGTAAVATSGDYERFFAQDGIRYHHLLDPRTGMPARGCRSVTVLAGSCARADALATAVFVLGPREGLALVERLPGVECLIVDTAGNRRDSSGMAAYLTAE